jgi:cysteine desulfurase
VIHWDYNAGAPLRPPVREHLGRMLGETWGNPSSVHQVGRQARARLDDARARVAALVHAQSSREIIFTASGSEAGALAIIGAWLAKSDRRRGKIVTTEIEHPCILGAVERIASLGARPIRIRPGPHGALDATELIDALDDETFLCSVMWANNETGVVQPIEAIAAACRQRGIVFHTDAVQAVGKLAVDLEAAPIDLMSMSAHKVGGPAGSGVLVARRTVPLAALTPGHQEDGRRGGTPSVVLAEGAALAMEDATVHRLEFVQHVEPLRDRFEEEIRRRFGASINGAEQARVPNTSSAAFPGADAEALLIALDLDGITASTGAACASGSLSPSHVLLAMGQPPGRARQTLRFSLGPETTRDEVKAVVAALEHHLPSCRAPMGGR